jgi:hypothetical protein
VPFQIRSPHDIGRSLYESNDSLFTFYRSALIAPLFASIKHWRITASPNHLIGHQEKTSSNVLVSSIIPDPDEEIRDKHTSEKEALNGSFEERAKLCGEELLTPWSWVKSYSRLLTPFSETYVSSSKFATKDKQTSKGHSIEHVPLPTYPVGT